MVEERIINLLISSFIQGVTEVFPVSSSGHTSVVDQLFGLGTMTLGDLYLLHFGSLAAILMWFRYDFYALWQNSLLLIVQFKDWFFGRRPFPPVYHPTDTNLPIYLLIACISTAVSGTLIKVTLEPLFSFDAWHVAILLILNGLVMLAAVYLTRGNKQLAQLTYAHFIFIGLVQGCAVLPGISRLGFTVCACLWCGLNWYDTTRIAFYLSVPVIAGAIVVALVGELQIVTGADLFTTTKIITLFVSSFITLVTTWFCLTWFTKRMLERKGLLFFGQYCCGLGLFLLVFLFSFGK